MQLVRVDPLTMEPLTDQDGNDDGAADGPAGGSGTCDGRAGDVPPLYKLPGRDVGAGALMDWWRLHEAPGPYGPNPRENGGASEEAPGRWTPSDHLGSPGVPWAATFDLSTLPYLVDTDMLVKQRQLQVRHPSGPRQNMLRMYSLSPSLLSSLTPPFFPLPSSNSSTLRAPRIPSSHRAPPWPLVRGTTASIVHRRWGPSEAVRGRWPHWWRPPPPRRSLRCKRLVDY